MIFSKYVSVVSAGINVLVCKTSPISHTVTSDLGHSPVLSDLSLWEGMFLVGQGRKTGRVVVLGVPDSSSDVPLNFLWANAFQNNCGLVEAILCLFGKENQVSGLP